MTTTTEPGLRERKRAETEAALVRAAYDLAEGGIGAVTAEAIADRAGVSRRTFFNYFPSVESALSRGLLDLLTEVGDRLAEHTEHESLLDALDHMATAPSEQALLARMARLGVLGAPEVHTSEILHCVKDDWVQWFATFIRDRAPEGTGDLYAIGLANAVVAAAHSAMVVWATRTGAAQTEDSIAELRSLLAASLRTVRTGFADPTTQGL